jgi:hypothetical protein
MRWYAPNYMTTPWTNDNCHTLTSMPATRANIVYSIYNPCVKNSKVRYRDHFIAGAFPG